MKSLHIPNPCSENWELMSPKEKGRFCSICNKCVIDFTQKQPDEIQQIIDEKKDQEVCGRFYDHQLNKTDQSEKLKTQFFKYIPAYFQNNRITLAVFSLILFLTGCSKQKEESCKTTKEVQVLDVKKHTLTYKKYMMGEPLAIDTKDTTKIPKKDTLALKKKQK